MSELVENEVRLTDRLGEFGYVRLDFIGSERKRKSEVKYFTRKVGLYTAVDEPSYFFEIGSSK